MPKKNRKDRRGNKSPGKAGNTGLSRKNRRARNRLDRRLKGYESALSVERMRPLGDPNRFRRPGALDKN